jgi:large subunit ribosomal protein L21
MYAIIETGGKQYRVQEGDVITVEKLNVEAGKKVEFDKVLVMNNDADLKIGAPYVEGAKVFGNVLENGKAKKVIIFKYKAKKDERKKQGHRQPYSMVEITGIGTDKPAKKTAAKKAEAKEEAPKTEAKAEVKSDVKPSLSMKKDELIAFANERGIAVDAKATKQVILDAIEAALK